MKKERALLKYRGTECLNCFQPLDKSEQFCHNCGQLNSTKKLAFNDFFNEFFAGILAYDSRLYRTLSSLLFNPGKISKDYIEGKRQRYANPYRFYLSASIIFFLIYGFTSNVDEIGANSEPMNAEEREEVQATLDSVRNNTNVPVPLSSSTSFFTGETLEDVYLTQAELDSLGFWTSSGKRIEIFSEFYDETQTRNAEEALDSLKYQQTRYNKWLYKKSVDMNLLSSDSSIFINYFLSKLPFIIFFYLPVFALFIWLLYLRRPFTYMEHLIFTFHNQTMWFVLFSIAVLLNFILDSDTPTTIAILLFLFYLYKAMRRFYRQGRVKTVLKFLIINGIFFILALIAAVFSLIASFAIY